MRKRSKYRPKGVRLDTMAYIVENFTPITKHDSYLIDLKIKNHHAMTMLTTGHATKIDMDVLIPMGNICEALYRLGFGTEYKDVIQAGLDALHAVGKRGWQTGRFILRAEEMTALNTLMELHDAQMEVITVRDMEKACQIVRQEFAQKKMRVIVEKQA